MEVEKVSIGENIKKLREGKNMTQEELANLVNVNQSMICQIERGTKIPNMLLAIPISEALGCSIGELYGE